MKSFADDAGERKHCRKKHPELIGQPGIRIRLRANQDIPANNPLADVPDIQRIQGNVVNVEVHQNAEIQPERFPDVQVASQVC